MGAAAHAFEVARLLLASSRADAHVSSQVGLQVARLADVSDDEAAAAVARASAPDRRPVARAASRAFEARFGPSAAARLAELEAADLTLEGYAESRGPRAAVRLLDALYALAARDGEVSPAEQTQLEQAAVLLAVDPALQCLAHRRHARDPATRSTPVALPPAGLSIGRAPGADLRLVDPQVAPIHAEIRPGEGGWRVVDAGSGRGTMVSGRSVRSAPVGPGDVVELGPYRLSLDGDAVRVQADRELSALSVRGLRRRIGEKVLLDDVSFTVLSGEVVAVVGPSGAGKTTLLDAISGVAPADTGEVLLDGRPLHALLQADPTLVGSVPQDDIVSPELTVAESLEHGARLRLPDPRVDATVQRVLSELSLTPIRDARIGDALRRGISGGQRKRVNLGQELLSRSTTVLFLDEPTSGLDPRAAHDIVRVVRKLADHGRIAFLVSHDLSPVVMAQVDHLLVLVPGGHVAWFGPPDAACSYFGVATPDAIFDTLGGRSPEAWAQRFRESRASKRFVQSREALPELAEVPPPPAAPPRPSAWRQLVELTHRYGRIKGRDRTGLWVLGLQPVFLAAVMALVFPAPTAPMLFVLTLSCLWFGMSASVRELIADRAIWRRERRVGVGLGPWLASKVVVLSALAVAQCTFLSTAVWLTFSLSDYGWPLWGLVGATSLIGVCGMALGLTVSALLSSTEAAVGTLLLLLIPQITLSGLLVSLRDLVRPAWALTWVDPLRYGYELVLKVGDKLATPERVPGKYREQSFTGALYDMGFKGTGADDLGLSIPVLVGALLLASALFLAVATVAVRRSR